MSKEKTNSKLELEKENAKLEFEQALLNITKKLTHELNDLSTITTRFIKIGEVDIAIENTLLSDNKDDKSFERVMVLIDKADKVKSALGFQNTGKDKKEEDKSPVKI